MSPEQIDELIEKGIEAAEKGYFHSAQVFLGQAAEHRSSPQLNTYLAFCMAKGQGRTAAAAKICRESIKREPKNPLHFLILGRILLLSGNKGKAIDTMRRGLKSSQDQRIIDELKKLGLRKPAVIKNLKRNHILNRICGKIFSIFGLR
ncbi:MAG: tetratricopeptide repeat protein [Proteobacteria bacterium]|nr:tetratricopeptide repeat protein [Pseudomonadota bacterium]